MPQNIEIKARVRDPERFRQQARQLADHHEILVQNDTFFNTPQGRLKVRVFAGGRGELIYYERDDAAGPKPSAYWIFKTSEPKSLLDTLSHALGVCGAVCKKRELYLYGQTRIHLDDVQGLGIFAELEVMRQKGQSLQQATAIAQDLMRRLGIDTADLVEGAYIDLMKTEE